ncbi:methyl-accepting chemotaxis protein [Reichenbachiella carrageenanivorans]|uniref:Methyl-accepting chemotaxis protein n=1 Tax=Reichenbachiella carrageenanivorans TaxID=2979869 RepID=A0ABY6D104_9BACT|nr:methyl-accepting chemotaxis protein [Reichenbachiella carrageenanivorans]UXX79842.1 methyl-accepting chemotaxis protein [Reichenbachiella carrageenanivorans]
MSLIKRLVVDLCVLIVSIGSFGYALGAGLGIWSCCLYLGIGLINFGVVIVDFKVQFADPFSGIKSILSDQFSEKSLEELINMPSDFSQIAKQIPNRNHTRHIEMLAQKLGEGDLTYAALLHDEEEGTLKSLSELQDNFNAFISETNEVIDQAVSSGQLSVEISTVNKKGVFLDLTIGINSLLGSLINPLKEFNRIIHAMSSGDLTLRYELEAKGDILRMVNNLNLALDNIDGLLGQVSKHSKIIEESSGEMKTTSLEMNVSTEEIASAIAEMSEGARNQVFKVDQASELIDQILEASKDVGQKAENVNETAKSGVSRSKEGIEVVRQLGERMEQITEMSESTTHSINVLIDRSVQIERVLKVITEIAAQTNLLALNAAIEAAQAGDAGRGFSVVAEEIRVLAENSRKSAREIEALVAGVQKDTRSAANVIDTMIESIKGGKTDTHQAAVVFQEMFTSSNDAFIYSEEILAAVVGQIAQIKEVVTNTESVVVIAEQTASGAAEIAASASELSAGMGGYNEKAISLDGIAIELKEGLSMVKLSSNASTNTAIFKMKEAYEKEKYLLDALLNNMPDVIYFKDLQSRFVRNSKSHAEVFGVGSPEDLLGKTDIDFVGDSATQSYEDEQKIIKTGEPIINLIEKSDDGKGAVKFYSTTKLPLRDLNHEIVGTFGISRDVTETQQLLALQKVAAS